MPDWVSAGVSEYSKRLPHKFQLSFIDIAPQKRHKPGDVAKLIEVEGQQILAKVNPQHTLIALDLTGKILSTQQLKEIVLDKYNHSENIDFVIGGADGLSHQCLAKAHLVWSMSNLTFPHPVVRVILAEQIYRTWSMIENHPYHR